MRSRRLSVSLSLTELPQFRRLLEFVIDVEDYARLCADDDLLERVKDLREDLVEMGA